MRAASTALRLSDEWRLVVFLDLGSGVRETRWVDNDMAARVALRAWLRAANPPTKKTFWVDAYITQESEAAHYDCVVIQVDPVAPGCVAGRNDHQWGPAQPRITGFSRIEVCTACRVKRITTDMALGGGEQGLCSVEYTRRA